MAHWHTLYLRKLVSALRCETFDLRIVALDGRLVAHRPALSSQCFTNSADWMAAMSAKRHHVFFRPDGALAHVLVDDLTDDALHLMICDGIRPSAVVETSVDNFQAWVTLPGRDHSVEVRRAASKVMAERYCGDPASAKPTQHGRVPTTRNPKPSRAHSDGMAQLVLLKQHGLKFSPRLLVEARERVANECERALVPVKAVLYAFCTRRRLPWASLSDNAFGNQSVVEAFFRWDASGIVQITPSIQAIFDTPLSADGSTEIVFGLRTRIAF